MSDIPEWERVRNFVQNCGVLRTEPMLGTADCKHLLDRITKLEAGYREAISDIADWSAYASDYFQEKHDLAGCLARHRALLGDEE
jgi:hypothetical protein